MGQIIGKNISKSLSSKNFLIILNNLQQTATDALKTISKKAIEKIAGAKRLADKIIKISNILQQNNLEIVENEHDREAFKERYVSPEERQKIIDEMRLI